jgi:hypothetical protein
MRNSFFLVLFLLCFSISVKTEISHNPINSYTKWDIIIMGTVKKLGKPPLFVSGISKVCQLAEYNVDKVCIGEFAGQDIMVEHLILTGKELNGVEEGDKVLIMVQKPRETFPRKDNAYPDIENKKIYYRGQVLKTVKDCSELGLTGKGVPS